MRRSYGPASVRTARPPALRESSDAVAERIATSCDSHQARHPSFRSRRAAACSARAWRGAAGQDGAAGQRRLATSPTPASSRMAAASTPAQWPVSAKGRVSRLYYPSQPARPRPAIAPAAPLARRGVRVRLPVLRDPCRLRTWSAAPPRWRPAGPAIRSGQPPRRRHAHPRRHQRLRPHRPHRRPRRVRTRRPISRWSRSTTSPTPRRSPTCSPSIRSTAVPGRGERARRFRGHRRPRHHRDAERDPAALPWRAYDIDVVIEATGRFRTRADAAKHLEAGARR